jgi:hypothetical protein
VGEEVLEGCHVIFRCGLEDEVEVRLLMTRKSEMVGIIAVSGGMKSCCDG